MNFNFTLNPRHWFQKRTPALAAGWAESRNRMRYNALFMLDPDVLVRNLGMFAAGDIAGMERILEEFEARDDKMKVGSFKMAAAVASKPWEVRIAKGEEDNPAAKRHQEVLTRFWNRITVTDAFCRNRRGGLRTLVKQMMGAQSRVYAVHDVSWAVRPDGELEATFTQVPAWNFENRTGELRYLKEPGAYAGVEMKDGEWLVTVGEGVGVTAAILAMAKRLSWNDWLLFSEKCGMPVILGNTGAKEDTPAWNALMAAIKAIAPKTGLLADVESKIQAVPFGGSSGTVTYKELVETVDRAISSLYRGGDLATMSKGGDGVGTNAQDGESELMDADGCAMVSETLNRQIERHVVRFTCGDFEPLAGIVLNPPAETEDVDREIKIDMHLAGLGVKLSKADALARYGRTEAEDEDDALQLPQAPQNGLPGGMGALPNEETAATPFKTPETPFKNPPSVPGAQGDGKPADASRAVLDAFAKDTSKAAEAVKNLLDDPTPEKAQALLDDLPSLIPDDPALAAVIAEEMAKEFKSAVQSVPSDALANDNDNRGKTTAQSNSGSFAPKGGGSQDDASKHGDDGAYTPEHRAKIGQTGDWKSLGLPSMRDLTPDPIVEKNKVADSLRRVNKGITVTTPLGNNVVIDKSTLTHWHKGKHPQNDIEERLKHLDGAIETLAHPHEIWYDPNGKKNLFVRITELAPGRKVVNAVEDLRLGGQYVSWHVNEERYDYYRKGELKWLR